MFSKFTLEKFAKKTYKNIQSGISFLEILIVVSIIGVTASFLLPSYNIWKINNQIEADFKSLVSLSEYLRARATVLNGTSFLVCTKPNIISFIVSSNNQTSNEIIDPNALLASNIIENPSAKNANFNALSGKTYLNSKYLCTNNQKGIFNAYGLAGVAGGTGPVSRGCCIDIEVNYNNDRINYDAYRMYAYPSNGFIQKYKWIKNKNAWVETD